MSIDRIGHKVQIIRKERGLTQIALAQRAHVSLSLVKKVEQGSVPATTAFVSAVSQVLRVSSTELADPSHLPGNSALDLAEMLSALRRIEDETGAASVLPAVLSMTRLTANLMRDVVGSARQGLLAIASQQAQFTGWLHVDLGKHDLALQWYKRSGEQAREVEDDDLSSTIFSMISHLYWSKKEPKAALALAEAAITVPRTAPVVQSQAFQQYARALSMNGQVSEIDRYLDLAEALSHDQERLPPWLYFHDVSRVGIQRGIAYVEAGRGDDAARVLDTWIGQTPSDHVRDRGWNYALLARARAMAGDADGALDAARHAAEITMRAPSAHTGRELTRAARTLRPGSVAQEVIEVAHSITARRRIGFHPGA
jgi:transcriptional regulator with XRE-family HTH domain